MTHLGVTVYFKMRFEAAQQELARNPRVWLVTGIAGFIGSNLGEFLLKLNQRVVGIDNFSTGFRGNLEQLLAAVAPAQRENFTFIEGDVAQAADCSKVMRGVDYVLHQAAIGSVPRSIVDPVTSNRANIDGTLALLVAAKEEKVSRFVYASSSSIYGDHPDLPKVEEKTGKPLSPYAVTKCVAELYANVFAHCYGLQAVGLRYFNVFGARQDPNGAYSAVIPRWIANLIRNEPLHINGDGETSRDFCYIANVIQANVLAATVQDPHAINRAYNVALGDRTTLNELFEMLRARLQDAHPHLKAFAPSYQEFRKGDIRHSQADISAARDFLGYQPTHKVGVGLDLALQWYLDHLLNRESQVKI